MKILLLLLAFILGSNGVAIPDLRLQVSLPSVSNWDVVSMMPSIRGDLPVMDILSNLNPFTSIIPQPKLDEKGVKTTIKNETKGNMHVTTVEKNGKNFHMVSQTSFLQGGNVSTGNDSIFPFLDFGGEFEKAMKADREVQCSGKKVCSTGKYCDPISSKCRRKVSEGSSCVLKEQCTGSGIICIWGICSKAKSGQPGTFCKKNKDCKGDSSCNMRRNISPYYPVCSPRLDIGSVCGRSSSLSNLFQFSTSSDTERDPCKKGLKCISVGIFGTKLCVSEDMKIKIQKKNQGRIYDGDDRYDSNGDDGSTDSSGEQLADEKDDENAKKPPKVKTKNTPDLPKVTDPMNPPNLKLHKKQQLKNRK